jgi:hypothetical protein
VGKLENASNLRLPGPYCVTTAMTFYGKGIAYAAMSNISEAAKQREPYLSAAARVPESRRDPNRIVDILKRATSMLGL